jgi:hypothetical protein
MVKVQLVVVQPYATPLPRVLAGPTFRNLVAALQALPRRSYVAPQYWLVDTGGVVRLYEAGLRVDVGVLEPALRELAHRAILGTAGAELPLWRPSAEEWL